MRAYHAKGERVREKKRERGRGDGKEGRDNEKEHQGERKKVPCAWGGLPMPIPSLVSPASCHLCLLAPPSAGYRHDRAHVHSHTHIRGARTGTQIHMNAYARTHGPMYDVLRTPRPPQ